MPKINPRTLSRGEVHELERAQTTYNKRLAKLPPAQQSRSMRLPDFRPKRLDGVG